MQNCSRVVLGVIVPAWHGESLLHRSLDSLCVQEFTAPDAAKQIAVIVAVNDGGPLTYEAALAWSRAIEGAGYHYEVIRTPPGRRAAIDFAEARIEECARMYLDQDAKLSKRAVQAVLDHVSTPRAQPFLALHIEFETSPALIVNAFLRGWKSIPYVTRSPTTAGCYVVTEEGRRRWTHFPFLASDDKYVRLMFAPDERHLLADENYEVVPPASVSDLIRARLRYRHGNRQLAAWRAARGLKNDGDRSKGFTAVIAQPSRWIGLIAVLFVGTAVAFAGAFCDAIRNAKDNGG